MIKPIVQIKSNRQLTCGSLLILAVGLTACDSGNDVQDLQSRVDVAASNYTRLKISAINPIIEINQSQQMQLSALTDSDESGTSVAASALWSLDNTDVATIDQFGLLTGKADGRVNVTARYGPLFAATAIDVSAAEVQSIKIESPVVSVNECQSVQLQALGNYADGNPDRNLTNEMIWEDISTTTVGVFNATDLPGFFRTNSAGEMKISASRQGVTVDDPFTLTVLPSLSAISISEPAATLTTSSGVQLTAIATFNDSTTADISDNVSWVVSDTTRSSVDNTLPEKGLLTASQNGSVTVSANCGSAQTASLTILAGDPTVVEAVLFNLTSPQEFIFGSIRTINIKSKIRLETQQEVDITEESEWTLATQGNSRNTLSNAVGSKGQLTIRGVGKIVVKVRYTGDEYNGSGNSSNVPSLTFDVK